jgi:hypothetical protein
MRCAQTHATPHSAGASASLQSRDRTSPLQVAEPLAHGRGVFTIRVPSVRGRPLAGRPAMAGQPATRWQLQVLIVACGPGVFRITWRAMIW